MAHSAGVEVQEQSTANLELMDIISAIKKLDNYNKKIVNNIVNVSCNQFYTDLIRSMHIYLQWIISTSTL